MKGLARIAAGFWLVTALAADDQAPAVARAVWSDAGANHFGQPSLDGSYISCVDTATGDLALYLVKEGKLRRLTHKHPKRNQGEFAYFSTISPDGGHVAYAWFNDEKFYDLRVVSTGGRSEPRILFRNPEAGFVQPSAWSPDGDHILTLFFRKDNISQIALVSAGDGSVRVLKSLSWFYPKRMDLSPDGRFVVYDSLEQPGSDRRDILVLATDGASETPLVQHPANDLYPLWSRDGSTVLFLSDRAGTLDVWAIPVRDGKPAGEARQVVRGLGRILPMGLTSRGDYFFGFRAGRTDIYLAPQNQEGGEPRPLATRFRGVNSAPQWSPDGRRIAFLSVRGSENFGQEGRLISVRTLETGEETDLNTRLSHIEKFQWSPDGQSLLVGGSDRRGRGGLFTVDARTGRATALVLGEAASFRGLEGAWSADGKQVFYLAGNEIRRRELDSGSEAAIYRHDSPLRCPALSPDGGRLAFAAASGEVLVLPLTGRQPRRVPSPQKGYLAALVWAPDGGHLVLTIGEEGAETVWQVPLAAGNLRRLALPEEIQGTVSFHPDAKTVAFTAGKPKTEIWVIEDILSAQTAAR
jgi:Tol biopolymer transport system component